MIYATTENASLKMFNYFGNDTLYNHCFMVKSPIQGKTYSDEFYTCLFLEFETIEDVQREVIRAIGTMNRHKFKIPYPIEYETDREFLQMFRLHNLNKTVIGDDEGVFYQFLH